MHFKQGFAGALDIKIRDSAGTVITPYLVSKVEFVFGSLVKMYPGDVTFDTDHFVVPLTQQESLAFTNPVEWQVTLVFTDGTVEPSVAQKAALLPKIRQEVIAVD